MKLLSKNKVNSIEITISNRTVIRVVLLTLGSFLFLAAVQKAKHALTLLSIAFFLALALNMPVQWLSRRLPGRRKGDRVMATGISFLIIVVLLVGFLLSIVPPLARQTTSFIDVAPQLVIDVRSENTSLGRFVRKYNLESQVDKLSDELSNRLGNAGGAAFSTFSRVGSSIFSTLTIVVLTFMMLIEGPTWGKLVLRLTPDNKEEHIKRISKDMYKVITGFVNGQVTLAALAAVLMLVPLLVFNVSYPIALMVIVFFCGLIPMVGHTIGAIIVSTVALFQSPLAAIGVLAYYILYQQLENYVLQPKVQSNSTNMSPLLVFSSVVIGVSFGGLIGGLFAIPIAGCIRIVLLDYLTSRKYLSEPTDA